MAERNRVTPFGEIVDIEQRGRFLGNRGSIHRGHEVVRPWQVRRWIPAEPGRRHAPHPAVDRRRPRCRLSPGDRPDLVARAA